MEMVDLAIHHSWHSFDKVVVSGLEAQRVLEARKRASKQQFISLIMENVAVAQYIRHIGADKIFVFTNKAGYCESHLDEHAREAGLHSITEMATRFSEQAREGAKLRRLPNGSRYTMLITSPAVETVQSLWTESASSYAQLSEEDALAEWANTYGRNFASTLISNVALARRNNAALGQITSRSLLASEFAGKFATPSIEDVAFNLQLPWLDGVPVKDLLAIREHEASEFQAFRLALRNSILSRLSSHESKDAAAIADAIADDILEPTLIELDRKLTKAGELVGQRSGAAVGIGAVVTTVGLLAFAPLVAPGIVIAAGGLLASANDYIKERKEIKYSDMHFLWRAANLGKHHGK